MNNSSDVTIAVDVMGADNGTVAFIAGIVQAMKRASCAAHQVKLVGDRDQIQSAISKQKADKWLCDVEIVHADQEISMTDKPMFALKNKKNSSMFRAIELVKDGQADGMLSCGNTGCLMAGGTLKLRTMPGIDRPALCTMIPSPNHQFALIDVGANPSSTAINLVHNAILGAHYYTTVMGVKYPRVGLLSIGTEEGKGSDLTCEAHRLLKLCQGDINYLGPIEGFQLFEENIDVVVCDGFVGNILLKSIESMAKTVKHYIKRQIMKNPLRILGAILAQGAFRDIKRQLNPDRFSGAPFLGLNGVVIKSHGSSTADGISSALELAIKSAHASKDGALSSLIERINITINQAQTE
ncbi:MAG: phosphate acyltransferase PlsX [Opitutales bacterium]|nr:phosphate acyltransferase PlsX [Opitutales bacterium]